MNIAKNFLLRVGETGLYNGNSAALSLLSDGRLACCYGNRSLLKYWYASVMIMVLIGMRRL